jgi:hypothetical protein
LDFAEENEFLGKWKTPISWKTPVPNHSSPLARIGLGALYTTITVMRSLSTIFGLGILSIAQGDSSCPGLDVACLVSLTDAATWNVTAGCALDAMNVLSDAAYTVNNGSCYLQTTVDASSTPYMIAGEPSIRSRSRTRKFCALSSHELCGSRALHLRILSI